MAGTWLHCMLRAAGGNMHADMHTAAPKGQQQATHQAQISSLDVKLAPAAPHKHGGWASQDGRQTHFCYSGTALYFLQHHQTTNSPQDWPTCNVSQHGSNGARQAARQQGNQLGIPAGS